jgi:GTP-binding protein
VLVFLIESISEDPKKDYQVLLNELASFKSAIAKKKKIVALTKMDVADEARKKKLAKIKFGRGVATIPISSVAGEGIRDLLDEMWQALKKP